MDAVPLDHFGCDEAAHVGLALVIAIDDFGFQPTDLSAQVIHREFERILLAFSEDKLQRMEIADNFGQITRFRFSQIRRNPSLDPELFHFEPPSGIDLFSD